LDNNTRIAVGGSGGGGGAGVRLETFPITVGAAPFDTIFGYSDYVMWPDVPPGGWDFENGHIGHREILTEIEQFTMQTFTLCYSNIDPRVPSNLPIGANMVRAGFANTFNGPGGVGIPNYMRPSIGMVQSQSPTGIPANDFPANSFFT